MYSSRIPTSKRRQWSSLLAPVPALLLGCFLTATVSFWLSLSLDHRGLGDANKPVECPHTLSSAAVKVPEPEPSVLGAAACMIVMDDNHFLTGGLCCSCNCLGRSGWPSRASKSHNALYLLYFLAYSLHTEWLAFHYHTVNLTHLIITIDPDSLTRPTHVLDRWRDRMTIEEWQDEDFLPFDWKNRVKQKTEEADKLESLVGHRFRQAHFNLACLKALKKANRGWALMIDTDEYLFPNIPALHGEDIPSIEKPGSTLEVLNKLLIPNPDFNELDRPCIPVFRNQFSARESSDEQVNDMVPAGFDGYAFQTMRWRKYGYDEIKYKTKWGKRCHLRRWVPNKVIVDLGRLRLPDITDNSENSGNPHKPLDMCPDNVYVARKQTPIMTNHYMGTVEQWLYRQGDKRGACTVKRM